MIKSATGIDMCGNQLGNVVIDNKPASSPPENPSEGMVYWSTTEKCLKIYNGTAWVNYNPLDAYSFTKAADGILQILRYINSSTAPTVENLKIVDPSAFDTAGMAAQAYADARSYTDSQINKLLGDAPPEALDTLKELADAVEENQDLIASLQALVTNGVHKSKVSCPALTPSSGVCTWTCSHGLNLNSADGDWWVLCDVYDASNNEKIMCDIKINSATNVIIKFASTETIKANAYYAVFVG